MAEGIFIECSKCGHSWTDRTSFLSDEDVSLVGYQVHLELLPEGLFMFNHNCGTTFSVPASAFRDLYSGPVFANPKPNRSDDCPGHCLYEDNLMPCPKKCECSYVRDILQVIKKWPKGGESEGYFKSCR